MTTARDIVYSAMKQAGVLGIGQTANAEDTNDCLGFLQDMMSQWQQRRWLVPSLQVVTANGNGAISMTVGPSGLFNVTPRPNDIKAVYLVQLNNGLTLVSFPLIKIFSYETYSLIAVKTLSSLPTHFFYDNHHASGLGNIFFWPIPTSIYQMNIIVETGLDSFATLDSLYTLPAQYREPIRLNLALRIVSAYNYPIPEGLPKLAKISLNTIRTSNTQVPTLQMPPALRTGRRFNFFSIDGY